mmetsp:Transcript_43908/g.122115  ORF Transcript_43908/g.122115 Transcript_43908/m.122115 type:complete len:136 (-) Transcript_43908:2-409(-)
MAAEAGPTTAKAGATAMAAARAGEGGVLRRAMAKEERVAKAMPPELLTQRRIATPKAAGDASPRATEARATYWNNDPLPTAAVSEGACSGGLYIPPSTALHARREGGWTQQTVMLVAVLSLSIVLGWLLTVTSRL